MKEIYIEKEDAVSPVIATILMVAITVVLAATVYILVSHYTSVGATTPFSGSLAEQGSNATSVTLVLTFSTPSTPLNANNFHLLLSNLPSGLTIKSVNITNPNGSWGNLNLNGNSDSSFDSTIGKGSNNPNGEIQSSATITISASDSSVSWTGVTVSVTYSGYLGTASTVLS